jgi:hypothetical protein
MTRADHPKTATKLATKTAANTATRAAGATRHYRVLAHDVEAARAAPGLYLVATPIGNLGDVTLRALETLAGVDVVACEDTRVTRRLFDRYSLSTPLVSYHDHNAETARPKLLARLDAGDAVALVSDAGTPLISDPGFKLVRGGPGRGLHGHRRAGRLRGDGGGRERRPADRPVLLRRLPAAAGAGAAGAAHRAGKKMETQNLRLRSPRRPLDQNARCSLRCTAPNRAHMAYDHGGLKALRRKPAAVASART